MVGELRRRLGQHRIGVVDTPALLKRTAAFDDGLNVVRELPAHDQPAVRSLRPIPPPHREVGPGQRQTQIAGKTRARRIDRRVSFRAAFQHL